MGKTIRIEHFNRLYEQITDLLDKYTKSEDARWSQKATEFIYVLDQVIKPRCSLLFLYEKTKAFAESLVAPMNRVASMIFSEESLKAWGYGSRLKTELLAILKDYDPYSPKYMLDEYTRYITSFILHAHLINYVDFVSSASKVVDYLSSDSKAVLQKVIENTTLHEHFKKYFRSHHQLPLLESWMGCITDLKSMPYISLP